MAYGSDIAKKAPAMGVGTSKTNWGGSKGAKPQHKSGELPVDRNFKGTK